MLNFNNFNSIEEIDVGDLLFSKHSPQNGFGYILAKYENGRIDYIWYSNIVNAEHAKRAYFIDDFLTTDYTLLKIRKDVINV